MLPPRNFRWLILCFLAASAFANTSHVPNAGREEKPGPTDLSLSVFCRDPVEAVCGADYSPDDLSIAEREKAYETIAETQLSTRPPRGGLSTEAIEKMFQSVEELAFGEKAKRNKEFATAPFMEHLEPLLAQQAKSLLRAAPDGKQPQIKALIEGTKAIASSRDIAAFAQELKNFDDKRPTKEPEAKRFIKAFGDFCALNGLERTSYAGYFGGKQVLVFCPGALLRFIAVDARKGKRPALKTGEFLTGAASSSLGHEAGHFAGYTPMGETGKDREYYRPFFKCVEDNVEAFYGEKPGSFPANLSEDDPFPPKTQSQREKRRKKDEMTADLNQGIFLAALVREARFETVKADLVIRSLAPYCDGEETPFYPSGKFRVRLLGLMKPLRAAIGCGDKKPDQNKLPLPASCGLSGKELL